MIRRNILAARAIIGRIPIIPEPESPTPTPLSYIFDENENQLLDELGAYILDEF